MISGAYLKNLNCNLLLKNVDSVSEHIPLLIINIFLAEILQLIPGSQPEYPGGVKNCRISAYEVYILQFYNYTATLL